MRRRFRRVVFIWVPAHAGLPCNAYADAIAKSGLHNARLHKLPVSAMLAREVTSRQVVYEQVMPDSTVEIVDMPAYAHTRQGIMTWVRGKQTQMKGVDDSINGRLAAIVGRGPGSDTSMRDILRRRAHARITYGLRAGTIPGGPQYEGTNAKAAARERSYMAMAAVGGCRACLRRGQWPAPAETTQHAFTTCAGAAASASAEWRAQVSGMLRGLHAELSSWSTAATTVKALVASAYGYITGEGVTRGGQGAEGDDQKGWEALRQIVGGIWPVWDEPRDDLVAMEKYMACGRSLICRSCSSHDYMGGRGTWLQQGCKDKTGGTVRGGFGSYFRY